MRPKKKSRSNITKTVEAVFYDSQFTKKHDASIKQLRSLYKDAPLEHFLEEFIKCLKVSFIHPEGGQHVENTLDFAAKFSVSLSNNLDENESCPFLNGILQFLFETHSCENHTVRYRVCHFLNRLFDNMGRDAYLDEEVYNQIGACMMERLQDKMARVRAEAVYALYRLQDSTDPSCRIISVFLYHLKCDPSYEVRCAILQKIAVNNKTLPFVLKRIHDVKDVVRKSAYMILNKLSVKKFSIRQRQTILENGLKDKFSIVRNFVVETLLPSWMDAYNANYIELLQSLNVESFSDICITALKELFKKQHVVPLVSMGIEDKMIPYSKLTSERVVFWQALAEYLKTKDDCDSDEGNTYFEDVLPELTPFTQYIQQYFFPTKQTENQSPPTEFVLNHLLNMTKIYDLSDEMGRLKLKDLCMKLLLSSRVGHVIAGNIAQLLKNIIPDQHARLEYMAEIVSELREPLVQNATFVDETESPEAYKNKIAELMTELQELTSASYEEADEAKRLEEITKIKQNIDKLESERNKLARPPTEDDEEGSNKMDTDTMIKCLTLIINIIEAEDIKEMNPILFSLLENFILPILETEVGSDNRVFKLALQVLGDFCILDIELAKERFVMFCFQIANESISETSLKVVFDLLHYHGLDAFNIEEPTGDFTLNDSGAGTQKQGTRLICLITTLLNSQVPETRNVTLQGLCKLIYARRISNPHFLTRLFLLWFNPDLEVDATLRQSLTVFFNLYATTCPNAPAMISDSFLITLKAFWKSVTDFQGRVDANDVANLLINLTRTNINKYDTKKNTHNIMAINICKELLEGSEEIEMAILIKSLSNLELNYKIQEDIENIMSMVKDMKKLLEKSRDKNNYKLASRFLLQLQSSQAEADCTVSTVHNTFPEADKSTATTITENSVSRSRNIQLVMARNSKQTSDNEDTSDEMDSGDAFPVANTNGSGLVIPDSSDSEAYCDDTKNGKGITIPGTPDSD